MRIFVVLALAWLVAPSSALAYDVDCANHHENVTAFKNCIRANILELWETVDDF